MSDDAERRRPPQFEPPPWERDRFEELARQRAIADRAAATGTDETADEVSPACAEPATAVTPTQDTEGTKAAPALDERKVQAMLIQLSGQEGPATRPVAEAGKVTAIILVAVGMAMVVFGAVLASRAAAIEGRIGAAVIVLLGALVTGFAAWMWVRANSEQGS
jgi:hypothetical protein